MTRGRRRGGFTLLESVIALSLAALVVFKLILLLRMNTDAGTSEMSESLVDDQARRALDQVAYALMGADHDQLQPDPSSPVFSDHLQYKISIGTDESGNVQWSDSQWVGLSDARQLAWRERPAEPSERRVVWCNVVRPLLQGEISNGVDDNGNGLIDEKGLTFTIEEQRVTIRLTLERQGKDGETITRSVESVVTCRN